MKELSRLVQRTFHVTPREEDFRTIALGASGRTIVRIGLGDRTCIGILWGDDRAALLQEVDHWPTYYPAALTPAEIVAEMQAH